MACSACAWNQWVVMLPATPRRAEVSLGRGDCALPGSSRHASHPPTPHFSTVLPMRAAAVEGEEGGQPHSLDSPAGLRFEAGLTVPLPPGYHYAWCPLEVCGHRQPETWGWGGGEMSSGPRGCVVI